MKTVREEGTSVTHLIRGQREDVKVPNWRQHQFALYHVRSVGLLEMMSLTCVT